ncbi:CPBP family intramembrane glutamic endopeptidase [Chloroflexus sp.]|uniref:CPBP family intramembrane glutamic endopeptidase n=1 Tax=Chloroflexus sp. TaxID=1904827 RepID=UPI002ACF07E2|nr:CPBP family intramembrane glutamic endopeptidase [Chloroflexus sp.]
MSEPQVLTSEQPPIRRPGLWIASVVVYILLIIVGSNLGGELGIFTAASFDLLPFVGLAVLAYFAGSQFNWAWIATGLWLALMLGLASLIIFVLGVITLPDLPPINSEQPPDLAPADLPSIVLFILGIFTAIGIGLFTLLPPVRRGLARVLPIDPDSFVHAIALMAIVSITLMMFVPLLITGEPPLLALVNTIGGTELSDLSADEQLRSQLYGLVWTIPAAFLAVGFGIRRNRAATLERLGLVRPTLRHLLIGLGVGLGLAGLMSLALPLMDSLWQALGWPTTDEEAFRELMAFAISPIGALVIGVTAGLGEELGVRGVLQPRLGIWLSNLFFTSLHAFQYHWDALLVVFVIGMACGLVRKHTNTTTAAIVHGVYNFIMVMLAVVFG